MFTCLLMALGGALLAVALVLSNGLFEQALLSDPSLTLGWGPTLFRVVLAGHGLVLWARGWWRWRGWVAPRRPPPVLLPATAVLPPATDWMPWGILLVLSILALGLRLLQSDGDLSYDEVVMVVDGARQPFGDIVRRVPSPRQSMLYAITAHATIRALGESAWTVRLPSVLCGVASLWALFLCGRLVLGTRAALLSCALMTVSYHHLWFSQNASGDMGLLLCTTLATWLWLESLGRGTWPWWVGYAVSGALGMGYHRSMMFVLAAHILLYLLLVLQASGLAFLPVSGTLAPGWRWRPWLAWTLCGTLTLQLYALALPELSRSLWSSDWFTLLWHVPESVPDLRLSVFAYTLLGSVSFLAGVGWFSLRYRHWPAAIAFLLPPLLLGISMLKYGQPLWPSLLFALALALLLIVHGAMTVAHLLCRGISEQSQRRRRGQSLGLSLTAVCIMISLCTLPQCYALPKQNFSGVRSYVEQRLVPDAEVVAVGLAGEAYQRYFAPHWTVVESRAQLATVLQDHTSVWLVYTMPMALQRAHPDLWQAIRSDFERVKVFPGTLAGGELYVYRLRTSRTALRLIP